MDSIGGLPAHPLLVHAPLVLLPVLAIVAIALAARAGWRRRFSTAFAIASVLQFILVWFATESGESLSKVMDLGKAIDRHEELAEATQLFVLGFAVLGIAGAVVNRLLSGAEASVNRRRAGAVLAIVGALVGVLATIWMIRAGHEGAKLAWDGVLPTEG